MTRRAWLTAGVAGAAALAGIGGALWRETRLGRGAVAEAAGLWDLRLPTPDGGELALASLRGRPLLLNFWATWCPPCVREMPALSRFQQRHAAQGWQVLGIAVDQREPVREFLARHPVSFPIVLAGLGGAQLARDLGNSQGGLPFSVLLNRAGEVVHRQLGEASQAQMAGWPDLI